MAALMAAVGPDHACSADPGSSVSRMPRGVAVSSPGPGRAGRRGLGTIRVGDWAVALRSTAGTVVASVCPFDPAYPAFVDLCRQCAGNRWLPRIKLAAGLGGGGSLVLLEFVAPVDHPVAGQFARQWRARAGDAEFAEVHRAAQMIDAEHRKSTPWWGGYDLDDAHIFRPAGRPVLIVC